MLKGYDIAKELVEKLYKDNQIFMTGVFDEGVKPRSKSKPKKKIVSPKRKYTKRNADENQRMSKAELIAFARRKGVVNFRVKEQNGSRLATKDEIRAKIKKLSNKKECNFQEQEQECQTYR